jgi:toxin ParE1/3/4
MLVDNPQAGRDRPELAPNLRSFPVGNYLIFYCPTHNGIEVVRVLNARQDISAEDMD